MNAITRIRPDESIHGTPAERAHRHSISIHCANCGEMEMAVRVELAMLRDAAALGMSRASAPAAAVLAEISKLATAAVFAPSSVANLLRLRSALTFTMDAARAIERALRDG